MMTQIAIVAVNYKTVSHALRFARSINTEVDGGVDLKPYLVDNSDDGSEFELQREMLQAGTAVSYVKAPGNLGYFGGARHGLAKHRRTHGTPDWLVVCNVDLTFDTRALIQRLAGIQDANIGVIAPQIISTASGRQLNPYMTRRPTRLRMHVYKWLFQSYIGLSMYSVASEWLLKRRSSVRSDHKIPRRIYAAHGAFMIFSKRYFTCGATLEHPPFLFGEEISVAEQARNAGLSVIYDPQIRVEHEEHVSISTLPSRRVQAFHAEAAAFIAEKYF